MLVKLIGADNAFTVTDPAAIFGEFNSPLEHSMLMVLNEVNIANKKYSEPAKALITDDTYTLHKKFVGREQKTGCHRIILATNDLHAVSVTNLSKRYFIADVGLSKEFESEEAKKAYFDRLHKFIDMPEVMQAFRWYLENERKPARYLTNIPKTATWKAQTEESLKLPQRLVVALLNEIVEGRCSVSIINSYLTAGSASEWHKEATRGKGRQINAEYKYFQKELLKFFGASKPTRINGDVIKAYYLGDDIKSAIEKVIVEYGISTESFPGYSSPLKVIDGDGLSSMQHTTMQ